MHALLHGPRARDFGTMLAARDHRYDVAADAAELDGWLHTADYDAVVIDPHASDGPEAVGWAAVKRSRPFKAALIYATAARNPDMVALYRTADDVMRLPIDEGEFVARLAAVVRRCRGVTSNVLTVGDLVLDQATARVSYRGTRVRVTRSSYHIIEMLMLRKGRIVGKDVLMAGLYAEPNEPDPKIIDVFVHKIRQALRDAGAPDTMIGNVWGRGYFISAAEPALDASAA